MAARVVIGRDNAGNYGLKCSLPGFDALTDDDQDPSKFSFNSQWTDNVTVHLHGLATVTGPAFAAGTLVPFSLPYIPFMEVKLSDGSTYYNDYSFRGDRGDGLGDSIRSSYLSWARANGMNAGIFGGAPTNSIFYVIYNMGI